MEISRPHKIVLKADFDSDSELMDSRLDEEKPCSQDSIQKELHLKKNIKNIPNIPDPVMAGNDSSETTGSCFSSSISDGKKKAKINDKEDSLGQLLMVMLKKIEHKIEKLDNKLATEMEDFNKLKTIEVRSKNPVSVSYHRIKILQNGVILHGEEHFQKCKKSAKLIKETGLYRCNCEKCQASSEAFEGKLNDVYYHIRKTQGIVLKCIYCPKGSTHSMAKLRDHIRKFHPVAGESFINEEIDSDG